jgi:hypothetical protein
MAPDIVPEAFSSFQPNQQDFLPQRLLSCPNWETRMQRYIPILLTVWLSTPNLVYSQETSNRATGREFAVSGVLMLPQGDWIRPRYSIAGGGGFRALFPVASSRVSAGVDSQVLFYQEGPRSSEQIITVHGLLRAHLGTGAQRSYVETVGGFKGFSVDPGSPGSYSYGVGAGLQLPIATRPPLGPDEKEFIEMGVRYLRGGGVRLTPGRIATHTHSFMLYVGWGFHPQSAK